MDHIQQDDVISAVALQHVTTVLYCCYSSIDYDHLVNIHRASQIWQATELNRE